MTVPPEDEPELQPGDENEHVLALQLRLQALQLFDGPLDGRFGDETTRAVQRLQEQYGVPATGVVDAGTWGALPAVTGGPDAAVTTPIGTLSEDLQWQWDGDAWQPSEQVAAPAVAEGGAHVSADGQWVWDGNQWQAVEQ
jgi:peptidoglycan hydrolase-like protein with peptidoglycan-binding domain